MYAPQNRAIKCNTTTTTINNTRKQAWVNFVYNDVCAPDRVESTRQLHNKACRSVRHSLKRAHLNNNTQPDTAVCACMTCACVYKQRYSTQLTVCSS